MLDQRSCVRDSRYSLPRVLGEGWGGGLQAVLNLCENRLCLHQRFAIRKTQHTKPVPGEPLCPRLVPSALIFVLPAIQLDYQDAFDTADTPSPVFWATLRNLTTGWACYSGSDRPVF